MNSQFFYNDNQIVGNLINHYIQHKNYVELKSLCSSIKKYNHLKDDFKKIISFLEKHNLLAEYLYNYHDKSFNFNHFKEEFNRINKISDSDKNNIVKIYHDDELLKYHNTEKFRLFVKVVGNTKQLSNLLNVKNLQIMWIANTPVWFVPYDNLQEVLNAAISNNIEVKVEKPTDNFDMT